MEKLILATLLGSILASESVYSLNSCSAIFDLNGVAHAEATRGRQDTDLSFRKYDPQGRIDEHSIREGQTAAHIFAASENPQKPYFFFAFPSGNSGVAMWFKDAGFKTFIEAISAPRGLQNIDGMNGAQVDMKTGTHRLTVDDTILSSMRFIRDRELSRNILINSLGKWIDRLQSQKVTFENGKLVYNRTGFNGVTKFRMELEPLGDTRIDQNGVEFSLVSDTEVRFRASGLTSEKPLTPLPPRSLFKPEALQSMDPQRLLELSFLTYKEKLMAGSPRYFTKFGRDSIYFLNVAMDAMLPEAIEDLLSATLSSMNPRTGQVSHEQHEGEFYSLLLIKAKKAVKNVFGYKEDNKMLDDDLAFAANLGKFRAQHPERWAEFLERKDERGLQHEVLVTKLQAYIEKQTEPFVAAVGAVRQGKMDKKQLYKYLIALHPNEETGQWRDSDKGLGRGRIPFDVNAAFVPAALRALSDIASFRGTSDHPNRMYDPARAEKLQQAFEVWNSEVLPLFEVRKTPKQSYDAAVAYYRSLGRDPAILPPPPTEDIVFSAISLDENGEPVEVMHSDDSLMMVFGYPTAQYLKQASQRVSLPFPYGLKTELGLMIANPIFASDDVKAIFGDRNYHGTVVWTMQEDMMVIGMIRQISRADLSDDVRELLEKDVNDIERIIHNRDQMRPDMAGVEVFSIKYENGRPAPTAFNGDAKGNSNQLWGHLRLMIPDLLERMKRIANGTAVSASFEK